MAASEELEHYPQEKEVESSEKATENSPKDTDELSKAPDGGLQAWLVVAGAFSIGFCCLGFANSFGTFEEYYLTHQLRHKSPDDVAWIGSVAVSLQFTVGLFAGPLFDRYGARIISPTAVVYIFAMMMLSLCKTYWQIMLTQGVLMGTCLGLLLFPAFAAVSQQFDKKRAAALGICVAGSSVGGVVIPVALAKLLYSSLGFGWSVRVIGFLIMPLMLLACVTIKARLPPRQTNFFLLSAFKDTKYDLIVLGTFFLLIGTFAPLFFIPTYAVSRGIDATLAGYLLAILNAASTFGRIIPGILADKFGRINMLGIGGVLTGVTIFCLNSAVSTAALVVYSLAIGFISGSIISGASAALSFCAKDPRDIGTYLGMGYAVGSIAALIGPPINGVLLNHYDGFFPVSAFSGVACLIGGFIVFGSKAAAPEGLLGKL